MEFRLGTHTETGKQMVEVWQDGKFVASIHGHDDGLRVSSKHFDGVKHETGTPPSVVIRLSE